MKGQRWRAAAPGALRSAAIDGLTALYHRPSGQTHLVAEPVPQILTALAGEALTFEGLRAALAERHEIEGDDAVLLARLAELEAAGLVERL